MPALSGCSGGGKKWADRHKHRSSREYLDMATESERPDERRKGVIGLAKSSDGKTEWARKVFDTLARTDPDMMVRCAALRALVPLVDAPTAETCLVLLKSPTSASDGVKEAPGPVRWCAARLLNIAVRNAAFDEQQRGPIVETLITRLPEEPDQNAKLAMVEALGVFPERRVLEALISAMESQNFAIDHAAEVSLAELTGVTHDFNAEAWRQWLKEVDDPFANAGYMPPTLETGDKQKRWDWLGWME